MDQIATPAQNLPVKDANLEDQTGGPVVTMVFPRDVVLTVDHGKQVTYKAGVQEVPANLAGHEWLKLQGVKKHEGGSWMDEIPPAAPTDITDRHVRFLQSRGYPVNTVSDAQQFFSGLSDRAKKSFTEDADKWEPREQAVIQNQVQIAEGGSTQSAPGGPVPLSPIALPTAGAMKTSDIGTQPGAPPPPPQQPPKPQVDDTGSGRDTTGGLTPPTSAGSSGGSPAPAKNTPEGKAAAGEAPKPQLPKPPKNTGGQ